MGEVHEVTFGEAKTQPMKSFFGKSMQQTTIADTLIIHTTCVAASVLVPMGIQGWVILMRKLTKKGI